MHFAAVGLGSNLGDRLSNLRSAAASLKRLGDVVRVSSLYETAPVGGPRQGPYLNAVVLLSTELAPDDLLTALLTIEKQGGRQREVRWGPRTVDLDLILYDEVRMDLPHLTLPHPRAHQRRFVLEPLAEIWPEAPLTAGQAGQLVEKVARQQSTRLTSEWAEGDLKLAGKGPLLVGVQFVLLLVWGGLLVATGMPPDPGWRLWLGGGLVAAGGGLAGWGVAALGPSMSVFPEPPPRSALVVAGPYQHVRHPIYGGLIIGLLGAATIFGSLPAGIMATALTGFFLYKAVVEERYLRLVHARYGDYITKVKYRLFPGIL